MLLAMGIKGMEEKLIAEGAVTLWEWQTEFFEIECTNGAGGK